ncbi:MAG: LamG protein, partial [Akkermansiaceae bacterium]|nr:LamG protein [Akkermansiaceae bacterium]
MNKFRGALQIAAIHGIVLSPASSAILVNLDPATALYDSDVKGIVNDAGNGPGTANNKSGVPLIDDDPANTHRHELGFTFNVAFAPLAEDLAGTRLLIEIGATSNGSGLYLIDGVPTFVGKQGSGDAQVPSSLNDATLPTLALQSSIGKLEAGTSYSLSVSWNQAGTLELKAVPDGGTVVFNSFSISGTPGNWSGNDTLGVKTIGRDNLGGLAGKDSVKGAPFDVDNTSSFAGQISRALFWNANSVTALQLTAPLIKGFAVTRSQTAGSVRVHWNVSEGGLANPTTVVVRNNSNQVVYTAPGLTGFADVSSADTHFTLVATNATGSVSAVSNLEADTSFSSVVLADAPAAWYRFNDAPGSSLVVDSAPNSVNHDGVLFGALIAGSTGFIDGAGSFLGASAVTGSSILNPGLLVPGETHGGFTVEAVVRHKAGSTANEVLLAQTDVNGTGRIILGVQPDGTLYTNLAGGTSRLASDKLQPGLWGHVVLVADAAGQTIRWYLDGKPIGSISGPDVILEASDGNWVIGSAKTLAGNFLNGDIDDVAVYPSLLDDPDKNGDFTDSRVQAHRNGWYAKTSGILYFGSSVAAVSTGQSAELTVKVGSDVTAVSIDHGVGTVPVVDGTAKVTVTPTATTAYRVTATRSGGAASTADATVTYQQVTAPVVLGFEATTLPSTSQVRLHWSVSAGDVTTPVTVVAKWGASSQHEFTTLKGFIDIPVAEATNLSLTVTNVVGTATLTAAAPA